MAQGVNRAQRHSIFSHRCNENLRARSSSSGVMEAAMISLFAPRLRVPLTGGDVKPDPGSNLVTGHAPAGSVQDTEVTLCRYMSASGRLAKPLQGLTVILRLTLTGSVHDAAVVLGVGCVRVQQRRVPSRPGPPMRGKDPLFRPCTAPRRRWLLGVCRDAITCEHNKCTQSQAAQMPPSQESPPFLMRLPAHLAIPVWQDTMMLAPVVVIYLCQCAANLARRHPSSFPCSASIGHTVVRFQGWQGPPRIRTPPHTPTWARETGPEMARHRSGNRAPEGGLRRTRCKG